MHRINADARPRECYYKVRDLRMAAHQTYSTTTPNVPPPIDADLLLQLLVALRGSGIATTDRERLRGVILDYSRVINNEAARTEHAEALRHALAPYAAELAPVVGELFPELARARTDAPERSSAPQKGESDTSPWHTRPAPTFQSPAESTAAPPPPTFDAAGDTKDASSPPAGADTSAVRGDTAAASPPASTPTQPTQSAHDRPETPRNIEPAPVAPHSSTEPPAAHVSAAQNPRERIREIKRAVNEMVGNPLSLLDRDEAVGRAYMDALLAATKRTLSGQDPRQELAALEDAYKRVQTILGSDQPVADKTHAPASTTPYADEATTSHDPPQTEPSPEPATAESADSVEGSLTKDVVENNTSEPRSDAPETASTAAPENSSAKSHSAQVAQGNKVPIRQGQPEATTTATAPVDGPAREASTTAPAHAPTPAGQRWVSSPAAPGVAANDAPRAEKAAPAQDKPDVEGALRQLLSEWQIFKKSGFLGMGPGGIEHPLFQTLRNLPMSAVVGGRFEGATPEVRQNIADYMNGWRYEHDIVHRLDETFEQYLRRVVAHILTHHSAKEDSVQKNTN